MFKDVLDTVFSKKYRLVIIWGLGIVAIVMCIVLSVALVLLYLAFG
jgi:hypothetical protein